MLINGILKCGQTASLHINNSKVYFTAYLILLNILQTSSKEWLECFHVLQEIVTEYCYINTQVMISHNLSHHCVTISHKFTPKNGKLLHYKSSLHYVLHPIFCYSVIITNKAEGEADVSHVSCKEF